MININGSLFAHGSSIFSNSGSAFGEPLPSSTFHDEEGSRAGCPGCKKD